MVGLKGLRRDNQALCSKGVWISLSLLLIYSLRTLLLSKLTIGDQDALGMHSPPQRGQRGADVPFLKAGFRVWLMFTQPNPKVHVGVSENWGTLFWGLGSYYLGCHIRVPHFRKLPCTQIVYTLAPKHWYLYRDYFKAKVYTIWVHGTLGQPKH